MPAHDLALLTEAAREAGAIALRYWRGTFRAWDKGGTHGPVTEADLEVDRHLNARLRAARPDYGWLSEETVDTPDRLAAERCFVADPIDGTRAFMAGEDTFAISLAVVDRGQPVAAAVYLPALDRLYTASATDAARCDGRPLTVSDTQRLDQAQMLLTRPTLAPEHWPGGVPEVKRSFRASLAYRLCLVAEGRHDGMVTLHPAWEWDIAAGALIAARAGAVVTDRQGAALTFNRAPPQADGVLAAPPALHGALMARLRPQPAG